MKSNIDTLSTANINFSCLLCLRRQRLQKIYISSTVAFLRYFNYKIESIKKGCHWQPFFMLILRQLGVMDIIHGDAWYDYQGPERYQEEAP